MVPGAATMPTRAVKMTSDITRGFSSAKIIPSRALTALLGGRGVSRSDALMSLIALRQVT